MRSFKKFVEDAKYEAYVLKNTNMGQFMKTPNIETDVTRDLNKAYQYSTKSKAEIQQKNLKNKNIDTELIKVKVNGNNIELA